MLLTYFPFAGQYNFLLTYLFQISVFIVFSMLFYYIKSYQKSHLQALSIYLMIFARTDSRALYRHEKLKLICCLLPVQRSFKKSLSIILLAISKKPPRKYQNKLLIKMAENGKPFSNRIFWGDILLFI